MSTGSLVNEMLSSIGDAPAVGMGATELCWTDRHAYTVIAVISPTKIVVQRDTATRKDSNGMSECQDYTYTPNPSGPQEVLLFKRTKNYPKGIWVNKRDGVKGYRFALGKRAEYHDFSF